METHVSTPTRHVDAGGIRFAYRRFGQPSATPIVLLQHFRGGLDHWDPLFTDGLAQGREVILVDNAGVAGSSGQTPDTIEAMAEHIHDFTNAIGLTHFDLLGFSMGGYVAQAYVLAHPDRVRRLVLIGTGPRAGDPTPHQHDVASHAAVPEPGLEDFLFLFFGRSEQAREAGRAFWARRHERKVDVDPPSSKQTMMAQLASFAKWREQRGERFAELRNIHHPTFVANGVDDVMIPTINSVYIAQNLPNAQLILYPDAGHAPHFQHPDLFLRHLTMFLDEPSASVGQDAQELASATA